MPDSRTRDPMPRDWADAFGALPPEAPADGGWQRLTAALPAVPAAHRTRWQRPAFALAATVLIAAIVPLMSSHLLQREAPLRPDDIGIAAPQASNGTQRDLPAADAVPPLAPENVADARLPSPSAGARATKAPRPVDRTKEAGLDALYGESARLEALLAQLPDNGATDAASIAVTTGLQDQVAHIDVALSQPALPVDTRAALWKERVDTLRQLTGVEATQRWNSAFGDLAYASDSTVY